MVKYIAQSREKNVSQRTLNIANGLTIARIIMAPIFLVLIFNDKLLAAFIVILIATLTDFLDGQIARIWKQQTRLGKMLDPIADKVIITLAVIALIFKFNFPLWVALIIFSRDILILTGGAIFMHLHKEKVLVTSFLGKITTFIQMLTVVVFVLNVSNILKTILIALTVLFTVVSAIFYVTKGYRLFFAKTRHRRVNLPNKITLFRIAAIPVFVIFLLSTIAHKEIVAAVIFIILALSDALDGYIARKRKLVTSFGQLVDPLADKLLVSSALIFLIGKGIDAWMAYVIIAREFIVTGIRTVAMTKHHVIPAKKSGKVKTFIQVVAITAVLVNLPFAWVLMLIAVLITLYSGIEYIWAGRYLFKELV